MVSTAEKLLPKTPVPFVVIIFIIFIITMITIIFRNHHHNTHCYQHFNYPAHQLDLKDQNPVSSVHCWGGKTSVIATSFFAWLPPLLQSPQSACIVAEKNITKTKNKIHEKVAPLLQSTSFAEELKTSSSSSLIRICLHVCEIPWKLNINSETLHTCHMIHMPFWDCSFDPCQRDRWSWTLAVHYLR